MKEFTITAAVTVSVFTKVKANSIKEAMAEAKTRSLQGLCHECSSGSPETEWSLTGELDGEPTDLKVDA